MDSNYPCPCKKCRNGTIHHITTIRRHFKLFNKGEKVSVLSLLRHNRMTENATASNSSGAFGEEGGESTTRHNLLDRRSEAGVSLSTEEPLDVDADDTAADDSLVVHYEDESSDDESVETTDDETFLQTVLYEGSTTTVEAAIKKLLWVFVEKSMSKEALSCMLVATKDLLPDPNYLPSSYKRVQQLLRKSLVPILKFHVCPNDCMIFRDEYKDSLVCHRCQCERFRPADRLGRRVANRYVSVIPIKDSLDRLFGCNNIAQIIQECGGCSALFGMTGNDTVRDITETSLWSNWLDKDCTKVILALYTDGVNPFHGNNIIYSCWPVTFTIMNLPKHVRSNPTALLLTTVIPGRNYRRDSPVEPNLGPYMELLLDQLIELASCSIYSAHAKASINVKVEVLLYIMDFQAYAKFFRMSGAQAYLNCNICTMKSERRYNKMVMLDHGRYEYDHRRNWKQEIEHRRKYDQLTTATEKAEHAKSMGVKGCYAFMSLPYHHRIQHTFIDGMHTLKDVTQTIMEHVNGRKATVDALTIEKESLQVADKRYTQLCIPSCYELQKQVHLISQPKSMKTHDWKQLAHHRVLQFCIQGFLSAEAEQAVFGMLNLVGLMCAEEVDSHLRQNLVAETRQRIIQFENLFPQLMNITSHLLLHLAEQIVVAGPLHSTWCYAYERFNSWATRKIKSRSSPESSIMYTYRLYEYLRVDELGNECRDQKQLTQPMPVNWNWKVGDLLRLKHSKTVGKLLDLKKGKDVVVTIAKSSEIQENDFPEVYINPNNTGTYVITNERPLIHYPTDHGTFIILNY